MGEKTNTTSEAAEMIGVACQTLHNWVNSNFVPVPKAVKMGKNVRYLWTKTDVERARKFKGTLKAGRKPKER